MIQSIVKFKDGNIQDALGIALQLVEILGKTEMVVLPKTPNADLLQSIMLAGSVDEATAREIYKSLITAAA